MTKKNRIGELIKGAMAFTVVALLLLTGIAAAASNPLDVKFIAQVPVGGDWKNPLTQNCGQTSSLMVFSFYEGTTPTDQGIKKIDDWLFKTYGDSQPINSYGGSATNTTILETLTRQYDGGKYGGFPLSYKASGWTVARVKQEIDAGHPVIVEVVGSSLGQSYGIHYLVAKGYTKTGIITNDPGRTVGVLTYTNTQFANAMKAQGGKVVVVIPNPITVTSPNGGESWAYFSTQTIQWNYSGNPGTYVYIEFVKGTSLIPFTSIKVPIGSNGKGSYSYLVTQATGSDYKVRITADKYYTESNQYLRDQSNGFFSITKLASPPVYSADLNSDVHVNSADLGILMSYWGSTSKPKADINQDGHVDSVDYGIMMSQWG